MNIYKEAVKRKLRVETPSGNLSVESLYDLSMSKLSRVIKSFREELKKQEVDDDLAFLEEDETSQDSDTKLAFELLKDIYIEKKEEAKRLREQKDNKEHNQAIMALIHQKEREELGSKSVEELRALLK